MIKKNSNPQNFHNEEYVVSPNIFDAQPIESNLSFPIGLPIHLFCASYHSHYKLLICIAIYSYQN